MSHFSTNELVDYSYAHRPGKGVAGGTPLQRYVRQRHVPCPNCGYDLCDLIIEHCPACEEALSVEKLKAAERQVLRPATLLLIRVVTVAAMLIAGYTWLVPESEGLFAESCEQLFASDWATSFGAPLGLIGALFYLVLGGLSFFTGQQLRVHRRRAVWLPLTMLALTGVGTIIWLLMVEAFVFAGFCDKCFWSHVFGAIACVAVLIVGPIGTAMRSGIRPEGPVGASRAQMDLTVAGAALLVLVFAIGQVTW